MHLYKTLAVCLTALICTSGISFAQNEKCLVWPIEFDKTSCDSGGKMICLRSGNKLNEDLNKYGCIRMVAEDKYDFEKAKAALSKGWPDIEQMVVGKQTIKITKKK